MGTPIHRQHNTHKKHTRRTADRKDNQISGRALLRASRIDNQLRTKSPPKPGAAVRGRPGGYIPAVGGVPRLSHLLDGANSPIGATRRAKPEDLNLTIFIELLRHKINPTGENNCKNCKYYIDEFDQCFIVEDFIFYLHKLEEMETNEKMR